MCSLLMIVLGAGKKPTQTKTKTSSPKGNDRSPDNKQVFLNSSQVSKRFFQLVKGS